MDGGDDIEGVLENLAGAGVDHRPLRKKQRLAIGSGLLFDEKLTRVGVSLGTQEMKIILLLCEQSD